jgi:site-specific DNA-methyltransferase (cytosine-N4-specific)
MKRKAHVRASIDAVPYYSTSRGSAYLGDAANLLKKLPSGSIHAIVTSPPYALRRKKKYGNRPEHEYVDWFLGFASEFRRILTPTGSLVIEIGGAWLPGAPVRSIYHFELLVRLVREANFHLAEEFFWANKAKMPSPAQWVTVERVRVKDAVTPIWWLSKTEKPKADNRRILKPYSPGMIRLFERGYNRGRRPSGHVVREGFTVNNGGAIPPNLLDVAHTRSTDAYQNYCRQHGLVTHPARFPREVPEFFIKFLTTPGDIILDPFAGSNVTGAVAESLDRRWIAFDKTYEYLAGSRGRFAQNLLRSR